MTPLGVVTGLASEAACFPPGGSARVACSGARPARAVALAEALLAQGCAALVSFGVAGGLDPALKPGTLVVADAVVLPGGGRLEAEPRWRRRLVALLARGGVATVPGTLAGSESPLLRAIDKASLRASTGAIAVDMESHAVANVALAHGRPFLALRAIADPASRAVPSWTMGLVSEDGRVEPWRAAFEAMCRPWDIPGLIVLGMESNLAHRMLAKAVTLTGGRLGLD